jgi:hypothetical protein
MADKTNGETLRSFLDSFSYNTRTDLNFKFLKGLSEQDAADFLQQLLIKFGDALNSNSLGAIADHIVEGQLAAYRTSGERYAYDDGPFKKLEKPLNKLKTALVTSSVHFAAGDDPEPFGIKNMSQDEAIQRIDDFLKETPVISAVPMDTAAENLRVRHGGYDIRAALSDNNSVFPIHVLKELLQRGRIGELAGDAYSFVGACSQMRMLKEAGPEWASNFQREEIEAMVLVPV